MRRGEVPGLRWSDIDFERASLAVRQTLIQLNEKPIFGSPKTSRGKRTIDLDPRTVAVLKEHRKRQLAERMAIGTRYSDLNLVFCKIDGSPLKPASFSQRFNRLVARSGLPVIRLHDLRHSHASHALMAGVPIKVVSERLGHASTSFTMDIYTHVMPGQQKDAAERIAALIFGAP